MPFRDGEIHLRDILMSIRHIEAFVGGMEFAAYTTDEKSKAAVERKLQILTEAMIRLEADAPDALPDVDWKAYRGMGNFLRHSYHRVSDEIVWNTVMTDLPALKALVEQALRRAG